jgi:hypothetical protein
MSFRTLMLLGASTAAAACSGDDGSAAALGAVAAEACLHATNGPFRDLPASADLLGTVSSLDRPHTAYRIVLPDTATGGHLGALLYEPRHSALYAFFTDSGAPIELRGPEDGVLPFTVDTDIGTCPALTRAITAELDAATPYRLIVGPTEAAAALLVVENVDEFAP